MTYIILHLGLLPSVAMVSPLNLRQFSAELQSHPDRGKVNYVLRGIEHGFDIGFSPQFPLKSARKNKASAYEHPEVVDAYLHNEVSLGRVLGPFDSPPLPDLHISGLGVIPKAGQPGKWRLILDLSSPHGSSVNDGIDPDLFSLQYIKFDDVVAMVTKLGRGALMAKFDVQSAYRNVAVLPSQRYLLGMKWPSKFFVDLVLPFGLRSAPFIFNSVAELVEWILRHNYSIRDLLHYLDDYITAGPPESPDCARNLAVASSVCQRLGLPLHPDKTVGPSTCLTVLGIELNTILQVARLPTAKLLDIKLLLREWRFPVVIAAHLWGNQWANLRVCFRLDNFSVVHILNARTSRDHHIMVLLRSLLGVAARFNFTFEALHIPGGANPVADALSRFNWQVFRLLAPDSSPVPTPIPEEILHHLHPSN